MKVKCAACGAVNSLDSLVANEAASRAIHSALMVSGELGTVLIGYLGLFRPAKSALTFDRVATLLNELLPMIQAAEIQRDRQTFPAPVEAWIYGINTMLANRTTLKLPLKSHGYLFEIISKWKPIGALQYSTPNRPLIQSKTTGAVKEALEWSNNG